MADTQTMRSQFEAHMKDAGWMVTHHSRKTGQYRLSPVQSRWELWQAAFLSSSKGEAEGWRSMDSAPLTGEWVFLYVPGHGPTRARWNGALHCFLSHTTGKPIRRATHWRPMFAAPALPSSEASS